MKRIRIGVIGCGQSQMSETERVKAISETGQESQEENECRGQSQTLGQNENDLGQEKDREVQITGVLATFEFPPKETQIKSTRVDRGVPANNPTIQFEVCPQTGFLVAMDAGPNPRSCRSHHNRKIKRSNQLLRALKTSIGAADVSRLSYSGFAGS